MDNIRFGRLVHLMRKYESAKVVGAHDFIMRLASMILK